MNFYTGLIMGIIVFIVVAYAIIFNVIGRQLDELHKRISDLEDEIYGEEDGEDEDLEEGDT